MNDKLAYWLLVLITFSGFIIRVWSITNNPPELFSDEIKGYISAKSIIETGKDINGKISFYFYNPLEYYPPVYGYLTYFSSLVFKNNIFAIRFPAVASGTIAIVAIFFLSEVLFKNKLISIFSAFFFAFIPWSIHFSRVGWEPSLLTTALIVPIIFFKLFIDRERNIFFFLSCIFFGLSIYTYRSLEFLSPLFLFILIIIYRKRIKSKLKTIFLGLAIFATLTAPYLYTSVTQPLMHERTIRISTFADGINSNSLNIFIKNYLSHFSLNYLFIEGDQNLRQGCGMGELYWVMLPLILLGIFYLLKNFTKTESKFLLIWLLIYPLGGSLTNDGVPHATRTLIGASLFALLSGVGLYAIYSRLSRLPGLFAGVFLGIFFYEFTLFVPIYFKEYPIKSADSWEYGLKNLFVIIKSITNGNEKICFTNLNYWHKETLYYYYLGKNNNYSICDNFENDCCTKASIIVLDAHTNPDTNYKISRKLYDLSGNLQWTVYKNKNQNEKIN